jgi:hypothetical protein
MLKKAIQISSGKLLEVYDDCFTYDERIHWFRFIKKSIYKIDGGDFGYNNLQLYSSFSEEDVKRMGFLKSLGFEKINEKYNLTNRPIKQARVNLSLQSEQNFVHTDGTGLTILYYPNLTWDLNWGGHTLFMDDVLSDAEYTCLYKPGRVVLFDGTIPHIVLTPTIMAKEHRFSFVVQLGKEQ